MTSRPVSAISSVMPSLIALTTTTTTTGRTTPAGLGMRVTD